MPKIFIYNGYYNLNKEEQDTIKKEQEVLKTNFGLNSKAVRIMYNQYDRYKSMKAGSVTKNVKFVSYVLKAYGYSEDETIEFMNHNFRMLYSNYADFICKLSIYYRCGIFDEIFFKHNTLLSQESNELGVDPRTIYAFAKKNNYNLSVESIKSLLDEYDKNNSRQMKERTSLRKEYPLTSDEQTFLYNELICHLKELQKQNNAKRCLNDIK